MKRMGVNMSDQATNISNAFLTFRDEAPQQAMAWAELVNKLGQASALDGKTAALAYLAVLAVLRLESGIPFHVQAAKQQGARARLDHIAHDVDGPEDGPPDAARQADDAAGAVADR